jgi:putative nucleotidyltransferase with HDIG domain
MKTELINLLECIEHLPVLPATTVRLVQLLSDKSTSIDKILEVIQYDQNLTLQVLKLCNSAYFGLIRQIHTLREALVYLGSKHLMQIILGIHCNSILQQPQKGYGLLPGMLWRHSTAVALAGEAFAKDLNDKNSPSSGLLFTAGLLHDIGKVVLDQVLSDSYQEVLALLQTKPMKFDDAEREVLGYSHTDVGELIMKHWKLPEQITLVSKFHHEPGAYDGANPLARQIIDLVHLADSLALSLGLGIGTDGLQYQINNDLANQYGLTTDKLDKISIQLVIDLQSLDQMFQER